ncbi:hypothetical protein [Streptacidiphilus sp. EB103A]|uniref:hypothetical protein n=1 Tax=Streptacidiphilus sp. EB103A TaxID=3156275 RepID=UPI0035151671
MWRFQDSFCGSVGIGAGIALKAIGFFGEPKVLLVGFQIAGDHEFSVCIEPETGPYVPTDLSDVVRRGAELYAEHPESSMWDSVPHVHEQRHQRLRDRMRAKALEEAFALMPGEEDRAFFSSGSVRVGDYEIHIVLSVDRGELERVPQISTEEVDRFVVFRSLVHAVISEVLRRASRALYIPDIGSGVLSESIDEIVRSATEDMMRTVLYCAHFMFGGGNHLLMSSISALPYEGRSGSGRIVISRDDDPAVEVLFRLCEPVRVDNVPAVRKLLEASGPEADLLSHGDSIYGFGTVTPDYDVQSETVFVISITGRGVWELSHAGKVLLTVRDGVPRLPSRVLDEEYFRDLVDRLFPDADIQALLDAAHAAGDHRHGAMLIISGDAPGEANRLSPQSWSIEPTFLSPDLLTQMTDMDGAVLIDPQGRCHAIGVILDGMARGKGDPARGSRYNNAIRYLGSEPPTTIVIVYSADGGINILPKLHPRIGRNIVINAVERYLSAASTDPMDIREASKAWDAVRSLRFYLSDGQCEALNQARAGVDEWERNNLELWMVRSDLQADPDMDDSYWL